MWTLEQIAIHFPTFIVNVEQRRKVSAAFKNWGKSYDDLVKAIHSRNQTAIDEAKERKAKLAKEFMQLSYEVEKPKVEDLRTKLFFFKKQNGITKYGNVYVNHNTCKISSSRKKLV